MNAPSTKDSRPWHFIVITERKILNRIPLYFPYAFTTRRAPLAIVVCGDEDRSTFGLYWAIDCAAACQNIILAAHSLGLGAVWCGAYMAEVPQEVTFQQWLGIPPHMIPFAIIPVGLPAENKPPEDRFDPSRIHLDKW
jgi:nitroreductase